MRHQIIDDPARGAAVGCRRSGDVLAHALTRGRLRIPDPLIKRPVNIVTEAKQLEAGAQDGMNRLYRLYAVWLSRRLRTRVDADAAADVVQETYLRIAPYVTQDIRHPKAFLLRIALNLVRDESRKQARRELAGTLQISTDAEAAPQFDQVLLAEIIGSMPQLYRDVFALSRFGGMTYHEIAKVLGISVKTVEWRMSRALEHCASRLDL